DLLPADQRRHLHQVPRVRRARRRDGIARLVHPRPDAAEPAAAAQAGAVRRMRGLANIFWLGLKELQSFLHDFVLLGLVIYTFSFAIYSQAQSNSQELRDAAIAIVDEDHSQLSAEIAQAFLPPFFKPPARIGLEDIDRAMDTARYTFVVDIPPHFQRDVEAGRIPAVQVNVDATAAMQAGVGAGYIEQILDRAILHATARADVSQATPVSLVVRVAYNPNITTAWFTSVMGIIT